MHKQYEHFRNFLNSSEYLKALCLLKKQPKLGGVIVCDLCLFREAIISKTPIIGLNKLVEAGLNPDLADSTGSTPLIEAAARGDTDLVKFLIDKCVNLNKQTLDGESAISYACANNHLESLKSLIAAGANVNLPVGKPTNSLPLDWAIKYGSLRMIKLLEANGGKRFQRCPE